MPHRSNVHAPMRPGAFVTCLAVLLAACGPASLGVPTLGPSLAATPTTAIPTVAPGTPKPTASPRPQSYADATAVIPVGAGPRGVAAAGGSIWVASAIGNLVQRVDPARNEVADKVTLLLPVTLVTVGKQLWVSVLNAVEPEADDQIVQIDPATGEVIRRVTVPVFHNIAAGAGSIWAVDTEGELRRVDPESGTVTSAGSVNGKTIGIAANAKAVWGIRDDGAIWRRPTAGGDLREAPLGVSVPGRSRVAVAGSGDVWVGVPGSVLALDPDDLTVDLRLAIPGMTLVNDLWVTGTDVWLSANVIDAALGLNGGAVLRLDPATAEIVDVFPLGPESSGVVVDGDSVWAVDQRDNVLVRYAWTP